MRLLIAAIATVATLLVTAQAFAPTDANNATVDTTLRVVEQF